MTAPARTLAPHLLCCAALTAGMLWHAPAFAASFDCSRAGAANEKIICSDAELSALDDQLGRTFRQARQRAADRRAFTVASDLQWRWREQNCHDRACLLDWYRRRQAELASPAGATVSIADAARLPVSAPVSAPIPAQQAAPAPLRLSLDSAQIAGVAPAGAMPWPHYARMERGQYFYDDPKGSSVAVRYYGVENGQYIIEVNRGDAVLRYTCSADCTYIAQLALPGDVEKDTVIVKNDRRSLPSLIVNDAVNGLLAQSAVR